MEQGRGGHQDLENIPFREQAGLVFSLKGCEIIVTSDGVSSFTKNPRNNGCYTTHAGNSGEYAHGVL